METESDVIKDGDYIIIKRQNYSKIHKVTKAKCFVMLGKDEIDLSSVIGQRFWSTYKLERKQSSSRVFTLKHCKREISFTDEIIKEVTSGIDNREIRDDGLSQKLSTEEIINLRSCGLSGQEIVSQLVENSTTFMNKTEYSQEKYLKKKEKKYFEYLTVRKPTLRLILEVLLRQPSKTLGLRMDTLAQITALANVRSGGMYLLYENGCNGMVGATIIDRLGDEGSVIHVHSGVSDHPTLPVLALNLPKKRLSQLMSLDIHQLGKKVDEVTTGEVHQNSNPENVEAGSKRKSEEPLLPGWKRRKLEIEDKALEILSQRKAESLIICGKEHPLNIFRKLINYVEISRPFVVYCPIREPLQELYCDLKSRSDIINIRLTESMLRGYQILPERTHPDINISGSGGYLLSGILRSVMFNLVKGLKSYMKNSSVHGLKYIVDEEAHWFERLFWVCVCVSCGYGTFTVFAASWNSYIDNPVSFVVETTYLDWNTTFPAVTVCEKRSADKVESYSEKIFGPERNLNLDTYVGDIAFFSGICSSCVYHCGTDIDCPDNLTYFSDKLRSPCEKVLKDCKWNDQEFDCCEEFEPIQTGFGECFTINSMQGKKFRQDGRTVNLISNRITGPGVLTFRSWEDIKIALHSPEDIFFNHGSSDQFAMIEYGQVLEMNFQVVEIVNDVRVRDIAVESRNCRFPDENPLKLYPYYSYSACMTECEGKAQMDFCGCMHHLMPKAGSTDNHPICNISGLICLTNHQEALKTLKNVRSDKPGLLCDCPSSCTEQELKILQSQVTDVEYQHEESEENSTETEEMDYSLSVTIAMISLPTERLSRNVVRTRLDIVVSMGGTAGLFLGASLLSIVELFYYFFIRKPGGKGRQQIPKTITRKPFPVKNHNKFKIMDYHNNHWKRALPRDETFLW